LSLHAESCSIATSVVGYLDHIHHQHPLLLLVDPVAGRRRILNQGDRLEFRKGHSVAWEAEFELLVDLGKAITLQDEVESWQKWKRACKALPETRRAPYLVPTYFRQRIQQEVQP
jgi:hypothetical protein